MENLKIPHNQKVIDFFDKLSKDENSLKKFLSLHSVEEMYEYSKKISSEEFSFLEFSEGVNLYFGSMNPGKIRKMSERDTYEIAGGSQNPESTLMSGFMLLGPIINLVDIIRNFREENEKLNEQIKANDKINEDLKKLVEEKKSEIEKNIKLLESVLESYKNQGAV